MVVEDAGPAPLVADGPASHVVEVLQVAGGGVGRGTQRVAVRDRPGEFRSVDGGAGIGRLRSPPPNVRGIGAEGVGKELDRQLIFLQRGPRPGAFPDERVARAIDEGVARVGQHVGARDERLFQTVLDPVRPLEEQVEPVVLAELVERPEAPVEAIVVERPRPVPRGIDHAQHPLAQRADP